MLISILRTLVPALWGSLIGWFLTVVPLLEPLRADLLAYGDVAVPVIAALIIGGWYAVCRWLEPHLPDWLTRILLGSSKTPVYEPSSIVTLDPSLLNQRIAEIRAEYETPEHAGYPVADEHPATEADPERFRGE